MFRPHYQSVRADAQSRHGPSQVSNVVDEPQRHLAMAADRDLADKFTEALNRAGLEPGDRVLIVNDITCGTLAARAARKGYKVRARWGRRAMAAAGRRAALDVVVHS